MDYSERCADMRKKNQLSKLLDRYNYPDRSAIVTLLKDTTVSISTILGRYGLSLLHCICGNHIQAILGDVCEEALTYESSDSCKSSVQRQFAAMVTFLALNMDNKALVHDLYNAPDITDDIKVLGITLLMDFIDDKYFALAYLESLKAKSQSDNASFSTTLSPHAPSSSSATRVRYR